MDRRQALAGLAIAGLALGGGPAGAAADADTPIAIATVHAANGTTSQDTVSLAQLQSGASQCPQYPDATMQEVGRQGPVTVSLPPGGVQTGTWSLASVLACMTTPIPAASVTGLTVVGADGAPETGSGSQLTAADLASPSDFAETTESPVISDNGATVQYDRPQRGGGDQDFLDEIQSTSPIALDVYEGPLLSVAVHASALTVATSQPVTFGAAVTGNGGSALAYTWGFGTSGVPASTAGAPVVSFSAAGTYAVAVLVTDAAGGGGGATLTITVTGPTSTHHGAAPTGPLRSRSEKPGTTPAAGHRRRRPTSPTSTTTTTTTAATTTTSTTTTTAPSTAATTPAATTRPPRRPAPRATRHAPPAATGGAGLVTGRLIGDVVTRSTSSSPLVHLVPAVVSGAAATAAAVRAPRGASIATPAGAVIAVLALLGLGAGGELRGRRAARMRHLGR